uniref:Uncharacterized protein n=1 Tax=Helianthus annuus TaxID=4232 RepID=A0A251SNS7_HELAN
MEIWCSFVSKLTEADMESVLAGRGLLFFYGSGHWILQLELIYYNRTQPHFCRTPESPNHKNAFFVLHRFINDNRRYIKTSKVGLKLHFSVNISIVFWWH